jgi:hypothetical protein
VSGPRFPRRGRGGEGVGPSVGRLGRRRGRGITPTTRSDADRRGGRSRRSAPHLALWSGRGLGLPEDLVDLFSSTTPLVPPGHRRRSCGTSEREQPDEATPRRWRTPQVPTHTVSCRPAADIAQLYRADGFKVQVVDLDTNPVVDAMFNAGRIRLATRDGLVVQASQGWHATGSGRTQPPSSPGIRKAASEAPRGRTGPHGATARPADTAVPLTPAHPERAFGTKCSSSFPKGCRVADADSAVVADYGWSSVSARRALARAVWVTRLSTRPARIAALTAGARTAW